jgi:alpha-D-xyloside xylohydrolase
MHHFRCFAYLRAAFARYASDGTPPFRALALDWPDVPEFAKTDDAWMVGDRLLVAPLFAGESGRQLILPPGQWHDYWTGKPIAGGTVTEITADTRNIPVFVKSGAVLPLATVANSTVDARGRELQIRIFGDGSLPFALETPAGSLHIGWNAKTGSGSVKQVGNERYSVSSWAKADQNPAASGGARA